jgi:hypothetical protein
MTALLLTAACASNPKAETPNGDGDRDGSEPEPLPTAMAMESELGSLDKGKVQETFREAMKDVDRCVEQGRSRQPLIGGAIEVVVRVDGEGRTRFAYLLQSDLGDHETETCILEALGERTWPRPNGGKEGETTQQLDIGDPEERPPVPWSPDDLGKKLRSVRSTLSRCRQGAGAGPIDVTFYVDPNGKVLSAGVAVADEKGLDAIDCAVRAVRAAKFPSPGSYASKVTVQVD